jgi:hypothetical protein
VVADASRSVADYDSDNASDLLQADCVYGSEPEHPHTAHLTRIPMTDSSTNGLKIALLLQGRWKPSSLFRNRCLADRCMHLSIVDPALLCQIDGTWGRERGGGIQPSGCWCCRSSDMPVRPRFFRHSTEGDNDVTKHLPHRRDCATRVFRQQNLSSNLQFDIDQMGPRTTADGKAGGTCGTAHRFLQERSLTTKSPTRRRLSEPLTLSNCGS